MSILSGSKLVSVILPTYNRKNQISISIDSILNQTYTNWELIIIDDGSTDRTEDVVLPYTQRDQRIQYIQLTQNGGASRARNVGIDRAAGDFITFLDSDDVYNPRKIELQVKKFLNTDMTNVGVITCGRNDYREGKLYNKWLPEHRGFVLDKLLAGCIIGAQTSFLMLSADVIKSGVRFDENINVVEDFDLVAQTLSKGFALDFVNDHLVDIYHYNIERNFDYPRAIHARDYLYNKYSSFLENNVSAKKTFVLKSIVFYSMIKNNVNGSATINDFKKRFSISYMLFSLIKPMPPGRLKSAAIKGITSFYKVVGM